MKYKSIYGKAFRMIAVAAVMLAGIAAPFGANAKPKDKIENRPYADLKRWHLGFSIGTSLQDFKFTHNGTVTSDGQQWFVETPSWSPGINVSVLADLRLHQYFNLRFSPGMSFGSKNVEMREFVSGETYRQDVKSVYVLLPVDLKISGNRWHNSRPYVTLGAMGAFDVGKKSSDYLKFNTFDAYLTVGLGCDFYLPFFKLNPEIKFCFGLKDILVHDRPDLDDDPEMMKITQSLSKVKSNMFMITFYFE
ncbi:MAG: PorT family protein [Candidatus Amulumruptor caecigallinarius]|nr:PorT family protein [Candidatus Amulumruptor caecigallinarius]